MQRVLELVTEVRNQFPRDRFFADFRESCDANLIKRTYYGAYNRAFLALDPTSWELLKQKALVHYMDHRKGQLKQGFFNQLNEAFAYRYLVRHRFTDVHFIPEGQGQGKTPDLGFRDGRNDRYCEVKSLCVSDAQISRRSEGSVFDGALFRQLDSGFLHKLGSAIDDALLQLAAHAKNGLVFLVISFDDISLDHYQTYRAQLRRFLHNHATIEVYVKIGILGQRGLLKRASSLPGQRT